MKFISWNVNGFRAVLGKGFADIFASLDADFFCLQETKMQPGQVDFSPEGYHSYWFSAEKKGYSGTAIFAKAEPISVSYGVDGKHTDEGRVITLEYEDFYLVCAYVPNAQDGLKSISFTAALIFDNSYKESFRICFVNSSPLSALLLHRSLHKQVRLLLHQLSSCRLCCLL